MIYSVCNQKGGVGKSTTVYHLARAAVQRGHRVLVVDADPQGNLTSVLTLTDDVGSDDAGLADALSTQSDLRIADVIVPGLWDGLDVVPTSGPQLAAVRDELVSWSKPGRESRLKVELAAAATGYDLVLIDCAPAIDQLTINALTASDGVLIVTQTKLWSVNGLAQLLDTIDAVREWCNPALRVAGLIVNQHESRTLAGVHWETELADAAAAAQLPMLTPPVPKRQAIADATESSRGLDEGDADARQLAQVYDQYLDQIAKEMRS